MPEDKPEENVNPPHNTIRHEDPEVTKMRLYWYHKEAGTLEIFYYVYPLERPVREPKPRGRGSR